MTEIDDGERILGELIYEASAHGLLGEEEAEALNEDLQEVTQRLRHAYRGERVYDEELTECPRCGTSVMLTDPVESNGEGVAFGVVRCANCGFRGREEWVHDRTVDITEPDDHAVTTEPPDGE